MRAVPIAIFCPVIACSYQNDRSSTCRYSGLLHSVFTILFGAKLNPRSILIKRIRLCAVIGFGSALLVLVPLTLSGELNGVHLGHGCWLASHLSILLSLSLQTVTERAAVKSTKRTFWSSLGQAISLGIALGIVTACGIGLKQQRSEQQRIAQDSWQFIHKELSTAANETIHKRLGVLQKVENRRRGEIHDLPHTLPYGAYVPLLLAAEGVFDGGRCKIVAEVLPGPVDRIAGVQIIDGQLPVLLIKLHQTELYDRQDELAKINAAADEFTTAVENRDQACIDRAHLRFDQIHGRLNYVAEVFLDRLRHPSQEVRRKVLLLFAAPESWKQGQSVTDAATEIVVDVVKDSQAAIAVRQAAVKVLMNWGRFSELADAIEPLSGRAELVPAITQFIMEDRAQTKHDVNTKSVTAYAQLIAKLPDWSDDPHHVIPALIQAIEDPRPWLEVAPTAARTLGRLGATAQKSLPALREASRSRYANVRVAAEQAIAQIENASGK
jgi:hypothetical protein